MVRFLFIFVAFFLLAQPSAHSGSAYIEAQENTIEEWNTEEYVTSGTFKYSVKLIDMPYSGANKIRSWAWFGLANRDNSKRFLVVFINTPKGEGIKLGYEYNEDGKTKYSKSVFNHLPLNYILEGEIHLVSGGDVIFEANGAREVLKTGLVEATNIFGATSATVEFNLEDGNAPNKSPQPTADGGS